MLSPEVTVALVLGVPSLLVAVAALGVAYLSYLNQRPQTSADDFVPGLPPQQHQLLDRNVGPPVPQAVLPGNIDHSLRRRPAAAELEG
ncbi:hypothetical protein PG999_010233 [Apiospora kogelbergensis]|uniref:Uncharacterized protein n=1 Tax=Apiospora kogelbergensis TaxID=1337665 RepID=A0AAW0QKJ1_9PEZI